jgi:acyl-homoserine-lactone acylase
MHKRGVFIPVMAVLLGLLLLISACESSRDAFVPPPGKYDVRILRDEWGVPHIFGKRDIDVAYGLAYAHCEDDWVNFEEQLLLARARLASVQGQDAAKFDYVVQLFRVREFVEAKYETEIGPETRALLEAYADGVSHFAALYPEKMPHIKLPVTGKDIIAGATLKAPFFYQLHQDLEKLFDDPGAVPISRKGIIGRDDSGMNLFARGMAFGSNAWAVGPSRSADGATRLAINSHMPWTGPLTWYEAHVHSEEGWNMIGGTFPGSPLIFKGHDEVKGWTHTINRPDLADIYRLELNPENENQYRFDGEWRDFERDTARMRVKLWGRISWVFKRELLWSVHGPAVRHENGAYAIRFAGYGEVRQLEQWYRMNKARNLDEFIDAMRMMALPSLNTLYADREGNMFYAYNGQFPVRAEGYNWKQYLPGDTSETLWTEFLPFEKIPQVLNPPSAFIQSCNNSPFHTTVGEGNPRPEDFSPTLGIETHYTNRSRRALELYGKDESITREEFYAYKYDKTYAPESGISRYVDEVVNTPMPDEPLLQEAVQLLKQWDRTTTKDNRSAALALLIGEGHRRRAGWGSDPVSRLRGAANLLIKHHGRLDIPWEEMMRLRRGDLDLGLGGGPDCLRAIDPELDDDGRFRGINGDCYFLMVEWDKDGNLISEGIHQFGSATVDTESPHYADQALLFADEKMKPTRMHEEDIRAHLSAEYRPGEERRLSSQK